MPNQDPMQERPAAPATAAWVARFRMRLHLRRPDLAPTTLEDLSTDAWNAGGLLSPVEVAELVAGSIDRRIYIRRATRDRRQVAV